MEKRSRLGRGLNSLMSMSEMDESIKSLPTTFDDPPIADPNPPAHELREVDIAKVIPNGQQPRRVFNEASLQSLAESIKIAGIIQPIIVQIIDGGFKLVAGERRWRAAKLAGCAVIPAIIRSIDDVQQAQLALIENIHREDLNPIDRAMAYKSMLSALDLTHQELAEKLGEERSSIANHLRLIDLEASARELVASGAISFGHAKILVGIDNPSEQARLAALIVSQQLSVRALEQVIKTKPVEKPITPPVVPTPHIADLERRMSRDLQMRTEVRQSAKGGKGRVVIHYASLDQFDQLLQRLNIQIDD